MGRMSSVVVAGLVVLIYSMAHTSSANAPAEGGDDSAPKQIGLFGDAPNGLAAHEGLPLDDMVIRQRFVSLDFSRLQACRGANGLRLQLNLFDDAIYEGVVEDTVFRSDDDYTLIGSLVGKGATPFLISVKDSVAIGTIRTADGKHFQILYSPAQTHRVLEVDDSELPPCGVGPEHMVTGTDGPATDREPSGGEDQAPSPYESDFSDEPVRTGDDTGALFDIMMVYTPAARTASGGTTAMQATINLAIDETNVIFANSGITPRVRLVHQGEVNHTENSSLHSDLDDLTDGDIENVHAWRDTYGADIVTLIVDSDDPEAAGVGWLMTSLSADFASWAFNVCKHGVLTGAYVFAHEMGHNLGCHHAVGDDGTYQGEGLYVYSHGWHFDSDAFRTVMAYAPGYGTMHFSNPDVSYNGYPTGVALGESNQAHNALSINNAAATAAAWRTSVVPPILEQFVFSPVASPQGGNVPFPVTVTAQDVIGQTVPSFGSTVTLTGAYGWEESIGTETSYSPAPFWTWYHDARTQIIYLQSEIGDACHIAHLSLNVYRPLPTQTMNNWTIRLKHTAQSEYSSPLTFDTTGWSVVYENDETISSEGWTTFVFDTPFDYNGVDNLLIDFSFDNTFFTSNGWLWDFASGADRMIYATADSDHGDPLDWSSAYGVSSDVCVIKLGDLREAPVSPAVTDAFTSGVWTGDVTVHEEVTGMNLIVSDENGNTGVSNAFDLADGLVVAPSVVSSPATQITLSTATLNGRVTNTGTEDPVVTMHWGDSDATTGTWDHSASLGVQDTEPFALIVGDLLPGTTYYFRGYAQNSAGASWTSPSASFTTIAPAVTTFAFDEIMSPCLVGVPFATTVTARDQAGDFCSDFIGTATLRAGSGGSLSIDGISADTLVFPFYALYPDARSQVIYQQSELGGAKELSSLSLDVTALPGSTLRNWTIRMKHTPLEAYPESPTFDPSGWTVVYRADETITSTGWVRFDFDTLFAYNGTDNLLIDFSFENVSGSAFGRCRSYETGQTRMIVEWSNNVSGDPLTWSGSPSADYSRLPALRIGTIQDVNVSPGVIGPFIGGEWSGDATMLEGGAMVALVADDGNSHTGTSNAFDVHGNAFVAASVASSPATQITRTTATLNGQITDIGYEDPTVALHWGYDDATTGTWDHSASLGVKGAGAFSLTVGDLTSNTTYYFRAHAQNSAGASWASPSENFTTRLTTETLTSFVFDEITSPRFASVPFPATVTALDQVGDLYTDFIGTVTLSGKCSEEGDVDGAPSDPIAFPLYTYYHDARSQAIYVQSELGGAKTLGYLMLDVLDVPGQAMNNWTIRMKHTTLDAFPASPTFDASGWTIVYQDDETIASTGWARFDLDTPFDYNGTDNLFIDFSFDNQSWSSEGFCRSYETGEVRMIVERTDSLLGDPLTWSGSPRDSYTEVPVLRIGFRSQFANLSPDVIGPFVGGVWSGDVTVPQQAMMVTLIADDGSSHTGVSNTFDVGENTVVAPSVANAPATEIMVSTATLNGEVTNTGGENPTVTLHWGDDDAATGTWDQSASLGSKGAETFAQTVGDLSPNTTYYFRARAQNSGGASWSSPSTSFTTVNNTTLWVDFGATGFQAGTETAPYRALGDAARDVAAGGTIRIDDGSGTCESTETFTGADALGKAMRIETTGAAVTIGR